ncbi:hypothetical protein BJ912DRAFT_925330 [Pholiota molesta]|nr:hypothetical protein BJ912DRAFT_925330 [Pholiota molesta]
MDLTLTLFFCLPNSHPHNRLYTLQNGQNWTTPEQKKWLEQRLSQYLEEQKRDRTSRFLLTVNEEWFKKFPEEDALLLSTEPGQPLSAEEAKQLASAQELRKTQLRTWFSWAGHARRPSSGSSQVSSFVAAIQANEWHKEPRRRVPQHRMRIQRQTTSFMLSNETAAVIEQVDSHIARWREKCAKEEKDSLAEKAPSHTPQEFQSHYFGPKSAAGNDFKQSYLDFDKGFAKPFSAHHWQSVISAAWINDDETSGADDEPSGAVISESSAVVADLGSSNASNLDNDNSEDGSDDNDKPVEGGLSGDEDLHRAESADSDRHRSVPGSHSPAPSVDDHHGSDWGFEPVAIAHPIAHPIPEQGPAQLRTPTPPPISVHNNNAPSSPIEHTFARMARQASAASIQNSTTPDADEPMKDYHNIDPQLLSLSRLRPEDSVLLDQGMEGFVYSPTPPSTSPAPSVNNGPSTSTSPDPSAAIDGDYTIANARMGTAQGLDSPASQSGSASITSDPTSQSGSASVASDPTSQSGSGSVASVAADASNGSDAAVNAKSTSPTVADSTPPAHLPLTLFSLTLWNRHPHLTAATILHLSKISHRLRSVQGRSQQRKPLRLPGRRSRTSDQLRMQKGTNLSKKQKSIETSAENERPRRNVQRPRRVDDSPKKK